MTKKRYTGRQLVPIELLSGDVVPSERWECARFVTWLEQMQQNKAILLFSHIANEATSGHARRMNWKTGTRAGVPDYVIVLPDHQCIWVEMKKVRYGRPTKTQLEWIAALAPHARVCYGSDEAIGFVSQYLTRDAA